MLVENWKAEEACRFVSLRGKTLKTKYFLFLPVPSCPSVGLGCPFHGNSFKPCDWLIKLTRCTVTNKKFPTWHNMDSFSTFFLTKWSNAETINRTEHLKVSGTNKRSGIYFKVVLWSKNRFLFFFRFWKRIRLTSNRQNFELCVLSQGCLFWVQVLDLTVRHYTRSKLIDRTSEGWI